MKMKKHTIALVAAFMGLAANSAVHAKASPSLNDPALRCEPPVIQVADNPADTRALFTIDCKGASAFTIVPRVTFSGQVSTAGSAPYLIDASYLIDVRSEHERALGVFGQEQQTITGGIRTSTESVALLPGQFAKQVHWDNQFNVLSIEEKPGQWRAYHVNHLALEADSVLTDAGKASAPVKGGMSVSKIVFDQSVSRFAAKEGGAPTLDAKVGMRDGKLEVLVSKTKEGAKEMIQEALASLDRKGADMARAWALAAPAQFLGLEDEVRYAERKVAAHNPHLLEEFQYAVHKILPFELPR